MAALLAVGVFGMGPMYLTEAERADYMALHGGPEVIGATGGNRGVGEAGAPAGSTLGSF